MQNSDLLLNTMLSATNEAVLLFDHDHRVDRVSREFEHITGIAHEQLLTRSADQLDEAGMLPPLAEITRKALSTGKPFKSTIASGAQLGTWEVQIEPIIVNGKPSACFAFLRPPHEHRVSALQGSREGMDAITGLPNYNLFHDRVEQAIHTAQRGNKALLVMQVRIDRFREINDLLGDDTGRQLLREITGRLRQCARTSDTVARVGNGRFGFLMQIAAIDDSVMLAEKVLAAFELPFSPNANEQDLSLTCSIGASVFPNDSTTAVDLIKNTAIALHHAEQQGRNGCQFFSAEMNTRAKHRLQVESGIRHALANNEFVAYYQPKINVGTQQVAGLEALVRWNDPVRGLVPPGEFIPIAEESGLIEQIGQWILEETCRQNRAWQDEGLHPIRASVNVSARQFRNSNFVAIVRDVLERTGLEPCWLELEITESVLMGDIAALVARMQELRQLGVSLSIDDFGTGYSSLSYLSRFPITTLKIDRAFVVDVQSNSHTAEIARAIIGLSRGLNLEVVAEGAEVAEQVDFLREHGCHLVQGFYYSKPLPAETFAGLLKNGIPAS